MRKGTVQIRLDGVKLDVDFYHTPPQRGSRDRYGAPLEPDYPAELEIETVWLDDVVITSLVDWRMEEIRELVERELTERAAA